MRVRKGDADHSSELAERLTPPGERSQLLTYK
jgi:hypothetical protein